MLDKMITCSTNISSNIYWYETKSTLEGGRENSFRCTFNNTFQTGGQKKCVLHVVKKQEMRTNASYEGPTLNNRFYGSRSGQAFAPSLFELLFLNLTATAACHHLYFCTRHILTFVTGACASFITLECALPVSWPPHPHCWEFSDWTSNNSVNVFFECQWILTDQIFWQFSNWWHSSNLIFLAPLAGSSTAVASTERHTKLQSVATERQ